MIKFDENVRRHSMQKQPIQSKKKRKFNSYVTSELTSQTPCGDKSIIIGKKINNNGTLDLEQEFGEIKRIIVFNI